MALIENDFSPQIDGDCNIVNGAFARDLFPNLDVGNEICLRVRLFQFDFVTLALRTLDNLNAGTVLRLAIELTASASEISDLADYQSRTRSDWFDFETDSIVLSGERYHQFDLTDLAAEVFSLPGWASGNAANIFMESPNSANRRYTTSNWAKAHRMTYANDGGGSGGLPVGRLISGGV